MLTNKTGFLLDLGEGGGGGGVFGSCFVSLIIDVTCLSVFNKEWWKCLFLQLLMKTITSMDYKLLGIILADRACSFLEPGGFFLVQSLICYGHYNSFV